MTAYQYRDSGGVARAARALLLLQAGLSGLAAAVLWLGAREPGGPLDLSLTLVELAASLATALLVLRWLYLASGNARALGAADMMVSPGWSVGWFFVPFANLVMPYVAVRDLWKASRDPRDWQAVRAPATIALWWGFWLAAGFAGLVAFRLGLELSKEASVPAGGFGLAADLLTIPAALLLARIIGEIQAGQARAAPGAVNPAVFA